MHEPQTTRKTWKGACHCGAVTFEVEAKLDHVVYCNCSLCSKVGALWHAASEESLRILTGEADLALYQFNTMTAKHYFCRHCGIHPLSRPRIDPKRWAVNVRCLEGVDAVALPVRKFDGQNWEGAAKALMDRVRKPS
ncbi:MAG TPA: GFA family protein [Burkholderiales bacterium]|nr:GFA family protein [Burkholderiales bacterium]